MNMWCTGIVCLLLNPFMDSLTNKSKNLVEIIPSEDSTCRHGRPIVENNRLSLKPKSKCISYDPIQLKQYGAAFNMIRDLGNYHLELFNKSESLDLTISSKTNGLKTGKFSNKMA